MLSDINLTDKELGTLIEWGSAQVKEKALTEEGEALYEKLVKLKSTRKSNAKSWDEFSKELEY
jgi:hypothetical protein